MPIIEFTDRLSVNNLVWLWFTSHQRKIGRSSKFNDPVRWPANRCRMIRRMMAGGCVNGSSLRWLLMPTIIGLDCTFLRTLARGVKACSSFDTQSYCLATVHKLVRGGCSLRQSARVYSTSAMSSVIEGKRAAAYFAVDEYIQVYVVRCQKVLKSVFILPIQTTLHWRNLCSGK